MHVFRVGVIGCGLIGERRAEEVSSHPSSQLISVVDSNKDAALKQAERFQCQAETDWTRLVSDPAIDAVVISTPNGMLHEIGCAALRNGKHALIEKPMGRNVREAEDLQQQAERSKRILKIGFNHRYHPALRKAHELFKQGVIGDLINIRVRYGHGGRPGYEKEWRGNPLMAGGGELTDQGIHVIDLIQWFCGVPQEVFCYLQTAVWPIHPLEDNGFGLLRYPSGIVASFHTSWTQWKNLFSFEIFGHRGSLCVEGLGRSYGSERLITSLRKPEGGAPSMDESVFEGPDLSWKLEWDDFVQAVTRKSSYWGTPQEGVQAMKTLAALYDSSESHVPTKIS